MLIDEVVITVKAGNGGNGAVSFRRNAQTAKGGPDGGNGGNGGNVFFQGSTNIFDLQQFQFNKKIQAEEGTSGKKQLLFGKNGADTTILVPLGTAITDEDTQSKLEILQSNQKVCIARGGKGGKGNNEFKSATEQTPTYAEKGEPGEEKHIKLVLKSIADIGLVGLPNVGKSTILSILTNAKPKIGDYPFTTLDPQLGIYQTIVIADIPGIISGASKGKGLGLKFLKHIEKTKMLLYCISATDDDPFATYVLLQKEFAAYDTSLLQKPHIVIITKSDLVEGKNLQSICANFRNEKVFIFSKEDTNSIESLKALISA